MKYTGARIIVAAAIALVVWDSVLAAALAAALIGYLNYLLCRKR